MTVTFTPSWVARLVREFDATGVHRASSPGDYASGEWLCAECQATGVEASRMAVDLPRTVVDEAYVECAGVRIDGMPMFDSPSAAAVRGTLGMSGAAGAIGYLDMPPNAASIKGMPLENIRGHSTHEALLVATRVAGESLAPINAQFFAAPFGPPVLQVAGMHHEFLLAQAQAGARAKLVSTYRREPAQSYNVCARIPSPSLGRLPLVVVTPRTGWWESTAERAGGLVAWLAAVATASALRRDGKLRCAVHAYATCGHELGHVGLNTLFASESPLIREAQPWLHLGANLGTASNVMMMLRASDDGDARIMRDLLVSEGYPADHIRVEPITAVSGEGRDLVDHGGRVLSLAGSNVHFHSASDRWPANVNAANTAAIARAVGRWVAKRAC